MYRARRMCPTRETACQLQASVGCAAARDQPRRIRQEQEVVEGCTYFHSSLQNASIISNIISWARPYFAQDADFVSCARNRTTHALPCSPPLILA